MYTHKCVYSNWRETIKRFSLRPSAYRVRLFVEGLNKINFLEFTGSTQTYTVGNVILKTGNTTTGLATDGSTVNRVAHPVLQHRLHIIPGHYASRITRVAVVTDIRVQIAFDFFPPSNDKHHIIVLCTMHTIQNV